MLTQDEASALVASARLAHRWLDPAMARDVETALGKILKVLPAAARVSAEALALYAGLLLFGKNLDAVDVVRIAQ